MDFVVAVVMSSSERHYLEKLRLKRLRDSSNPFELDEIKFKKVFRVPRSGARYIIETLDDQRLEAGSIPKMIKVLAALTFFAQGSYQTSIAQDNLLGLSQPSMCRCLAIVADGIIAKLTPQHIKFPITEEEINRAKLEFQQLYNMPNTLGAVDGTHVAIAKPSVHHPTAPGNLFYNRKGYYSINCQIVCSGSGKIIGVNPNFPGSTHDAAVWTSSMLHNHMRSQYVHGQSEQWLLGDKGYPLQPWLMTPIISPREPQEERYNYFHIRARNVVEMTIGRLKNKFRCLLRHRTLHYQPPKSAKIMVVCCTLYNMFKDQFSDLEDLDTDDDLELVEEDAVDHEQDFLAEARAIRQNIVAYFN